MKDINPSRGALSGYIIGLSGFLLILASWAGIRDVVGHERGEAKKQVQSENAFMARAIEEHTRLLIYTADLGMLFIKKEYERSRKVPESVKVFASMLKQDLSAVQVAVSDSNGNLIYSAGPLAAPLNISEREHFKVHVESDVVGLFVGKPVLTVATGTWSYFLSRRIDNPDGSFGGIVSVGLDPHYFGNIYGNLDLEGGRSAIIVGTDHIVRASFGTRTTTIGDDFSGRSPVFSEVALRPVGNYELVTVTDNTDRMSSYRVMPDYPLIVIASTPKALALAGFEDRKGKYILAGSLISAFVACSCALLILADRQTRKKNRQLEDELFERHKAEGALAAEKERLAVTLRSIGDGVIACDLDQKVVLLNKVAEEMTGWKAGEAVGRPLSEVFFIVNAVTRERRGNPIEKVLASGTVAGLANHTLLISRDGGEHAIADTAAPIRDHEGRVIGVVLVFRDVTGKEKVEEELARAQKLESLAVLAGGIAHDFNNLLTGILGNLSLSRAELPAGAKASVRLEEAERAALRARGLTQQLLTFSRGGAPVRRCVDLGALFDETARFAVRGSAAACSFDLASGLLADADPGQIGQVIHNLVLNAVQAMPGGGTVSLRGEKVVISEVNTQGLKAGEFVRLSVHDEGTGIPEHLLPRIFDPFFTTKSRGKGLGLAICHSIVKNHDGHIGVSSPPGKGTTFEVLLPACRGEEARAEMKEREGHARAGRGERIMVIDDEPLVRGLALEMLRALGFDPAGAGEGGVALDLYREAKKEGRPFAAVIMDLTIPGGMGGKETIGRLHEFDPAVRAIVSSGYSNDPVMANHAAYGFAEVLAKPYQIDDLRDVLARVLKKE